MEQLDNRISGMTFEEQQVYIREHLGEDDTDDTSPIQSNDAVNNRERLTG